MVVGDKKYAFHMLPSGIVHTKCVAVIGKPMFACTVFIYILIIVETFFNYIINIKNSC